jgi:flagellar assembly protein FliH
MSAAMATRKFLFGEDFRGSQQELSEAAAAERAAQEAAVRQAFENGVAEGRRQAAADAQRRLADALERLGGQAAVRFGEVDRVVAAIESEALAYFETLARKLARQAIAAAPLAAVGEAAEAAFRHLRGVPHLAARVSTDLVEETDALMRRLAREQGFEGRIIVLGDEELAPGDVRLDWAEGGVTTSRDSFEQAIERALEAARGPAPAMDSNDNRMALP